MTRSTIKLNHSEIQSYLDGDHGVEAILDGLAAGVLGAAQADPHDDSGDYEASLHIETERSTAGRNPRMVKRIVADVPYAMVVEANYGVLSRALDSA